MIGQQPAPLARAPLPHAFRHGPPLLTALRGISRRREYDELLDQPGTDGRALRANLAHLRLMNRWLGWSAGVWREVQALMPAMGGPVTVLDVATGSADVPRALVQRAAARGVWLRAIGSDVSAPVLAEARSARGPSVALVQHDAVALPFADGSVDVATLCLAAHHLDPPRLKATIAELWRVARWGIIVSDLERSGAAYIGARLMALVLRNPLTSHDGPVSVLRAYTASEVRAIACRAGLRDVRVRRSFPFRMTLVARKERGG